ncbi:uncharacterized protein LOC126976833 [Leptidea sinapis]|uniref:uncharacterized protein LOC126976833 n=1 Tax=Leptidea sinapis TaxID=189913 RepID=UPI0021C2B71E|nr:uncharacterized protein LOC126976833 [Leptidea sinapis]
MWLFAEHKPTIHTLIVEHDVSHEKSSGCGKKSDRVKFDYDEYEEAFETNEVDYPIIYDDYFYEHENEMYSVPLFDGRARMTARMRLPAKRFDIWAEVTAVCSKGTLVSASGVRDYLWMGIVDGEVKMRFDAGSGPLNVHSGKVNIDAKSKILARRYKNDGMLKVGSVASSGSMEGRLTSLDVLPYIHVGLPPQNDTVLSSISLPGFVGCVHRLRVSGRDVIPPSRGVTVTSHGLRSCTPENLADLVCPSIIP